MAALHIYFFNTHFAPILVLNQQFIRVSVMLYTVQMVMVKTDENGLGGGGWGCSECKLCKVDLKLENIEAEWHSK